MPNTNSTAHTAGPWFFSQESVDPEWYIVTIKGGVIVANVNAHFRQEANARLIAAAPDLLGAQTMGASLNTPDFLNWIADRLVHVHGEPEGADFIHSLRQRAEAGRSALLAAKGGAS